MTVAELNPDEDCGVCHETRENHGDKHHKFSPDGEFFPIEPGPPAKQQPPVHRDDPAAVLNKDPSAQLMLRVVERLVQNGLLDGLDLVYVFGGDIRAHTGGSPGGRTPDPSTQTMPVRSGGIDPQ